jgi:hypothetical protein
MSEAQLSVLTSINISLEPAACGALVEGAAWAALVEDAAVAASCASYIPEVIVADGLALCCLGGGATRA